MNSSINAYMKDNNQNVLRVWYAGSTALYEGQGMCYDALNVVVAAATVADGRRYNTVIVPVVANAGHFAGVCARDYPAKSANDPGQFIEIYGPGSVCNVLLSETSEATTLGVTGLACEYDASYPGRWVVGTAAGKSTAIALQTVTTTTADTKCLAVLQEGAQTGLVAST
jgi:hypothetical protein